MKILNDPNPITAISWEDGQSCRVGMKGVKTITTYEEAGEMVWFMVDWDDGTYNRYNGKYVAGVSYK